MKYFVLIFLLFVMSTTSFANQDVYENHNIMRDIIEVKVLHKYVIKKLQEEEIIEYALQCGEEFDIGETLMAITFLESSWGKNREGDNGESIGIAQIQKNTAKYILKKILGIKYEFTDVEIVKLLKYNDPLSIYMARSYLLYLMERFSDYPRTWSHSLLAFNRGPRKVMEDGLEIDPNDYVNKARNIIYKTRSRIYN